jgi:hypothetical protein
MDKDPNAGQTLALKSKVDEIMSADYPEPLDPQPEAERPQSRGLVRTVFMTDYMDGSPIPRGFGVAWSTAYASVLMPIPLNILARWALLLIHALTIPRKTWWEKRLLDAEASGYQRGHDVARRVYQPDGFNIFTRAQVEQALSEVNRQAYQKGRDDLIAEIGRAVPLTTEQAQDMPEEIAGHGHDHGYL